MKMTENEARKNAKRHNRIEVKLSDDELEIVREKAEKLNLKTAAYMRRMAVSGEIKIFNTRDFAHLRDSVNRIGNNINQIAHTANSTNNISQAEIEKVLEEQQRAREILLRCLKILTAEAV